MLIGHGKATLDVVAGEQMGGYMDRVGGVDGVHDDLEVHAVVFGTQKRTFALIICDLICVNRDAVTLIRDQVNRTHGVDTCWVSATHTHSGPESGCWPGGAPTPPSLLARLVPTATRAVGRAIAAGTDGRLTVLRVNVDGVAGRRSYDRSAAALPLDVLSVHSGTELAGVILVSPIHPTVRPADNRHCSADLTGGIRRALTARLAAGRTTPWVVVATGAAGDISTRHTRRERTWDEVDRLGDVVAAAVAAQLVRPADPPTGTTADLSAPANVTVTLSPKRADEATTTPPSVADADGDSRNTVTYRQGLQLAAELSTRHHRGSYAVQLETIQVDGVDLLAVPAELFLSLGEDIRNNAPDPEHFVLFGYTNGYLGYLPDASAYAASTYEVLASPVAPGSGEAVAAAATTLLAAGRSLKTADTPEEPS